jgi:predicted ATP-grasp superfamily ATP-dependent carboligase
MTIRHDLMETELQRPAHSSFSEARTVHSLVLLGFSTYLLAFARRVRSAGIRVYVIDLVSQPRGFVRRSNAVEPDGITLDWSAVGTPAGLATIHRFVNKVRADALLTTDDFSLTWLGKNRAVFEPACMLMIPQPEILEPLLDKAHQIELARECGFDLLPTWTLASAEAIATIPNAAFPVVVRPSLNDSARPIFKALVMNNREELSRVYASTQWSRAPIAQPFRLGPNYVLHGVRSESGEMLALRLFKAYRKYRGFTTSMTPVHLSAGMEKSARRFVEAAGLTGPFHFELLGSDTDDRLYFLEINCRLGGTTAKVMQLGFDEPGLLLEAFKLHGPEPLPVLRVYPRATTISLNLVQALDALRNQQDPLAYPQPRRMRAVFAAIWEALTVRDGLLDLRDLHSWLWLCKVRKESRI